MHIIIKSFLTFWLVLAGITHAKAQLGAVRVDVGASIANNANHFLTSQSDRPLVLLAAAYSDLIGVASYTADAAGNLRDYSGGQGTVSSGIVSVTEATSISTAIGFDVAGVNGSTELSSSSEVQLNKSNSITWTSSIDADGVLTINYTISAGFEGAIISKSGWLRIPEISIEYLKAERKKALDAVSFATMAMAAYSYNLYALRQTFSYINPYVFSFFVGGPLSPPVGSVTIGATTIISIIY